MAEKKELGKDQCRIIKIGKEALFELIYETLVEKQESRLEVDPLKVGDVFSMDWDEGSFIFAAYVSEDENENYIPFPEDIDIEKLLKKLPDTTTSVWGTKTYKEYSFDELRGILKNDE